MLRLCILAILAITIASCCRPIVVTDVQTDIIKAHALIDNDTIIPPPPDYIDGDPEPVQVYMPAAQYPLLAAGKGIESYVLLQVYVDKYGFVRRANVLKCANPGYGFEEAVMAAAYASKWKPAIHNGEPIGVWVVYKYDFVFKP